MKGLRFLILLFLAVLSLAAWVRLGQRTSERAESIQTLKQQIQHFKEIDAPKSEIELYKQLISLDGSMENRVGLAEAYYKLGQSKNYIAQCESIIKAYPEEKTGYLMLIKYYDELKKTNNILELYDSIPSKFKDDKEIADIYSRYEFKYLIRNMGSASVSAFYNGLAVCEKEGLFGYVNSDGSSVIPLKFEKAYPFVDKYAAVCQDGEWFFIDRSGDKVSGSTSNLTCLYSPVNNVSAMEADGKWNYVKASDFSSSNLNFDGATNFKNGVAAVKSRNKWYLINNRFETIGEETYDDVVTDDTMCCCCCNRIFVLSGGKYKLLDQQGKTIATGFDDARCFIDGYAAVKQNGKWGFINNSGEIVIGYCYDDADSFCMGLAPVCLGDAWYYIKTNGDKAFDEEFEWAGRLSSNGVARVLSNEKNLILVFNKFNLK